MSQVWPGPLRLALLGFDVGGRERLRRILDAAARPPASIILECATTAALLDAPQRSALDAVFVDLRVAGGWDLIETATRDPFPPEFVIVSSHPRHASRAFDLGVVDYLTKPVSEARMLTTLSRLWSRRCIAACRARGAQGLETVAGPLTARETQILDLIRQGMTNKEIGRVLGLSHFTVRNRVVDLFRRFGASRRGELARIASAAKLRSELGPTERLQHMTVAARAALMTSAEQCPFCGRMLSA